MQDESMLHINERNDMRDAQVIIGQDSASVSEQAIRLQLERLFADLEALPQESQLAFCSYLLHAVVDKLTASSVGKAVTSAHSSLNKAYEDNTVQPDKKRRATSRKNKRTSTALLESQLGNLRDPYNPVEAWMHFGGSNQLLMILSNESVGALELMLAHPAMPPGSPLRSNSNKLLAEAIVERLARQLSNR